MNYQQLLFTDYNFLPISVDTVGIKGERGIVAAIHRQPIPFQAWLDIINAMREVKEQSFQLPQEGGFEDKIQHIVATINAATEWEDPHSKAEILLKNNTINNPRVLGLFLACWDSYNYNYLPGVNIIVQYQTCSGRSIIWAGKDTGGVLGFFTWDTEGSEGLWSTISQIIKKYR